MFKTHQVKRRVELTSGFRSFPWSGNVPCPMMKAPASVQRTGSAGIEWSSPSIRRHWVLLGTLSGERGLRYRAGDVAGSCCEDCGSATVAWYSAADIAPGGVNKNNMRSTFVDRYWKLLTLFINGSRNYMPSARSPFSLWTHGTFIGGSALCSIETR